jgi:hypothetical protein
MSGAKYWQHFDLYPCLWQQVIMSDISADTTSEDADTTADDWAQIQAMFPRSGGRRIFTWLSGVHRLTRLLSLPAAGPLAALLDQRPIERIKALRTYAAINLEQASAALRMTVVVNVSIPVIVVAILSQISSGQIWNDMWAFYSKDAYQWLALAIPVAFALTVLVFIMALGATQLGQARDIRHLIDLFAADRGIYFGLDDMDDLQAD